MRKILFFILFCPILIFGQEAYKTYYNKNWEVTSESNSVVCRTSGFNHSMLVFDGKIEDTYIENNQTEMIGSYKNGKKEGEFIFYFPNGNIKLNATYNDGRRVSNWKEFYSNGIIKIEAEYIDNQEILLQLNDSCGHSLFKHNKIIFKQNDFQVKGRILNNRRHGKWTINSNELGFANLKYKNGFLKSGVLVKHGKTIPISYEGAFPFIFEPAKFYKTENLILEPGAKIKNSPILESIYRNKYLKAKKITIKSKKHFESFIENEFEYKSSKKESIIKIIVTVEDSKPVKCTTQPVILEKAITDLNLIVGVINKLDFISHGTFEMDYKVKTSEE